MVVMGGWVIFWKLAEGMSVELVFTGVPDRLLSGEFPRDFPVPYGSLDRRCPGMFSVGHDVIGGGFGGGVW